MSIATPQVKTLPTVLEILGENRDRYSPADLDLLERAYQFGAKAHAGQKRRSGDPYFIHCIEVTRLLAERRLDSTTLAAGLLHDVVEDAQVTVDQLGEHFPAPIPMLVEGVTKISSLDFRSSRERYIENLRKMILAMARDIRVVLIKLCDRLHNMRTLEFLDEEQQLPIARDTMQIYAPIANRLGMTRVKWELEDESMRYIYPEDYRRIADFLAEKRASRERIVQQTVDLLRDHLAHSNIFPEIVGRPKHFYSIYQKMQLQGLDIDQIYDLIALRVICDDQHQCYDILGHVHALWKPVPGRFKDYISLPKANLYQSLHTTVFGIEGKETEVQIRTAEMHKVAEEGIAAHWKYKEGGQANLALEDKLRFFRRLTEWLSEVNDPDEFMKALNTDVFADRVFCFSPRGDAFDLPNNATPLDFAYAVHSEVGDHCVGAKISGRIVPLRTTLKHGDVVEILTSKSAHPRSHWLEIVQTSRAKNKIRHWLRSQQREQFVAEGRERIVRGLRGQRSDVVADRLDEQLKPHLSEFGAANVEDLLADIGIGRISGRRVLDRLAPPKEVKPRKVAPDGRRKAKSDVIIDGMSNVAVKFANCCHPLPGEPIVGFITIGRGVTVHRNNCAPFNKTVNSKKVDHSRLVTAKWDLDHAQARNVSIKITARDRIGLLRDVTDAISQEGISITENRTWLHEADKQATLRFTVSITNKEQMNRILSRIRVVPGVLSMSIVRS